MPRTGPSASSMRAEKRDERPAPRVPSRTRALRFRLALPVVAITFPLIVLLAFASLYSAEKELSLELENRGRIAARWLDDWFASADAHDSAALQREVDRLLRGRSNIDDITVFLRDPDGGLNCVASRTGLLRISPTNKDWEAARSDRIILDEMYRDSPAERSRFWDISAPLHRGKDVIGALHLEMSLRDADAVIAASRRNFLLAALGALALTGILLFLAFDRAIGRPVEDLVAAMERARQGDLTASVEVRTLDELGWLSENFNRMLRRLKEKDEELARFNTELKRQVDAATAELARKNKELEEANHRLFDAQRALATSERLASLGQLASNIAHEIGTPLNSIYGHIQLLASEDGVPQSARGRIAIVESQVERLTAIIENVLKTLRLPEAQMREVEVNPVIQGVAAFTRPVVDRSGIKLDLLLAPSLPLVFADPAQLEQVIMNLFTNALDAMPGGGTLSIETAAERGEDGGEAVLVRIKDTGIGIPPEHRHRIFEPFFTTKGKERGTGLGLPICQQILKTFRGSISVESEVGKGSTFTVRLPAVSSKLEVRGSRFPEETLSDSDIALTSSDETASAEIAPRTESGENIEHRTSNVELDRTTP